MLPKLSEITGEGWYDGKLKIKNPNRSRAAWYLISWDFLILTGIIISRCRATGYQTQLRNEKNIKTGIRMEKINSNSENSGNGNSGNEKEKMRELNELKRFVSDWSSRVVDGTPFDELFQFEGIPLSWIYLPILYSSLLPSPFTHIKDLAAKELPSNIKVKTFSSLFKRYLRMSETLKWSLSRLRPISREAEREIESPKEGKVLFLTFTNHLSEGGDIFRINRMLEEIKKDGKYGELILLADPLSRLSLRSLLLNTHHSRHILYQYYDSSIVQQAAAKARELSAAWKAIPTTKKRQLLQYRQQDLFSGLRHNLDFLYSAEFIQLTLTFYLTFKKIIAQEKVKAVVLSSQNNIFEKCLTAAAKQYHLPVFVIQHGTGLATLQSIDAPAQVKFAVFGKYYQQRLRELGVKAANIQSTGAIIFDGIEKYRRPSTPSEKSRPTLLLMTSPLVEDRFLPLETYFERVRNILCNLKQLNLPLQIRLHLREKNATPY